MIKNIIFGILAMFSVTVMADVPFVTTAVKSDGTTIVVNGTLKGTDVGPTDGYYEAYITNAKSFKGDEFTIMNCTVHQELASPMLKKFKNVIELSTAYYEADGYSNVAVGRLAGLVAVPKDGYVVKINNKVKNNKWNLLKCTIK